MTHNNQGNFRWEYSDGMQQQVGYGYGSSSFASQLINAVGPDLSIPRQHDGGQSKGSYLGHQPALFDQSQLKGGFGPVYATPSFPWHHSPAQGTGVSQWQQWGNHHQAMMPYYLYYPYYMYPQYGHQCCQ